MVDSQGPEAAAPGDGATSEGAKQPQAPAAQAPAKAPVAKAKTQPRAAFKPAYRTGQRVILQNLKTEELNGHRGIVVKWKDDAQRYAVRVAGKEMGIKPENLKPEGGVAEAEKFQRKYANTEGVMYNPVVYMRTPGAGPKMTQWIGQVKAGRRVIVRAETSPDMDEEPIPLWFGDQGFVGSKPVDIALLISDIGGEVNDWPKAIARMLDRFPAAAGRLRETNRRTRDRRWQIVLNNAGVPFTTASVPPCGLPSAEELQLACGDEQCGFFDLGLADEDMKNGGEDPLLRLKLIYEEGTARGLLGVSFHHALCDITGIGAMLRCLHSELDSTVPAPESAPCFDREAAQELFDAVPDATEAEEQAFAPQWPLWSSALERWCFFARRLRSGLRGRPDGTASVFLSVSAETIAELKKEAAEDGEPAASAFDVIVTYLGMKLLRLGRNGHCTLLTKDYRAALNAAAPDKGFDRLFANVVTHGLSFQMPSVDGPTMRLGEACTAMRKAVDSCSLEYVRWHSRQDHFRGLPNMFGGLCCNTWGRALSDVGFVETYAIGLRSVDERASNMVFPLDAAYLQIFPQPSGAHSLLLSAPITEIEALLKELPSSHFQLPHVSQIRPHAFKVPLPSKVVDELNPTVETHHMFARIACIGDSMTNSVDDGGTPHGYPDYLQALFDRAGIHVKVRNFGKFSCTAQKFADYPYWDERRLESARLWRPHFVIATFGHNDAKESNWDPASFEKDYADLCFEFLERMSPRPHIFLVAPPPLYKDGVYDIQQLVVNNELPSAVAKVAHAAERRINEPLEDMAKRTRKPVPEEALAHTAVIDAFGALGGAELRRSGYMAEDGVHPNERGTRLLALTVFADMRREVSRCLRNWANAAAAAQADPMEGIL